MEASFQSDHRRIAERLLADGMSSFLIASFRCFAEFGPPSGHNALRLIVSPAELWVRGLALLWQNYSCRCFGRFVFCNTGIAEVVVER
jgi:hypothetical protein